MKAKFTKEELQALDHAIEEISSNIECADSDYIKYAKKHLKHLKNIRKKINPTELS